MALTPYAGVSWTRAEMDSFNIFQGLGGPVSGRVSRYVVTVGNLIQSGDQNGGTLLTTIMSVDPMYAYFDVGEYTVQRVRKLMRELGHGARLKMECRRQTAWAGVAA